MTQDVKILNGVMDSESSVESMELNDYLKAINISNAYQGDNKTDYATNLEGNIKVTTLTPLGQNRVIGSKYIRETGKAYFVRFNSMGRHQIVEFDYNRRTEKIIFENITNSNSEDILRLSSNSYFNDIKIVAENILVLNSGDGEILKFDIDKVNNGLNINDIVLIRKPPVSPPKAEYIDNPTITINRLKGKLFQFKSQVNYAKNLTSATSHTSDRVVPEDEMAEGVGQISYKNNSMIITVPLGDVTGVEGLTVYARAGNEAWVVIKEVTMEHMLNIPNEEINPEVGFEELYNPVDNEYYFIFKNDGAYPIADQVEVENLYDAIPQRAESLEVINGNIIAVGGITEGYDKAELEADANVSYYYPDIKAEVTNEPSSSFLMERTVSRVGGGVSPDHIMNYMFIGQPVQGDRVVMKWRTRDSPTVYTEEYTVTLSDESAGIGQAIQNASNQFASLNLSVIIYKEVDSRYPDSIGVKTPFPYANHMVEGISVVPINRGELVTHSIQSLKNNTSYQTSINLYDEYMRPFPIYTSENMKVSTASLASTKGFLPRITVSLRGEAPPNAKYFRIGITENRVTRNYVTLTGTVNYSTPSDYYIIRLHSLEDIVKNDRDINVNYEFTKGDRVSFISIIDNVGKEVRWFDSPTIDLEIVGLNIEVDENNPEDVQYLLQVKKSSLMNNYIPSLDGNEVVMELYTPKAETDENNSIFYEVGDTYEIVDGDFGETSVDVVIGDNYHRGRMYALEDGTSVPVIISDPNFMDDYASKYWSNGTPRVVDDQKGRLQLKGSIRYSDEYVKGSKINNINRFYVENIYGETGGQTSSTFGWIRGLILRNNTLVAIQERKVGIIPVYRTIIEDNADTSIVATSSRIFGAVGYRTADLGCGNSKTSISKLGNTIYFVDDNECLPCRDTETNGTEPISGKMLNYFKDYINKAKDAGSRLIGISHDYKNNYSLTIESLSDQLVTLYFTDADYENTPPDPYSISVEPTTKGTVSYDPSTGIIHYVNDTLETGRDDITVNIQGQDPRIIELNIREGSTTPLPFNFIDRNNVELSTQIESNTITISGIDIPTDVTVIGGEYSKNGGSYTNSPTTAVNGDRFKVRLTSSGTYETTSSVTLTVGGTSGTFNVRTLPEDVRPSNVYLNGDYLGLEMNRPKITLNLSDPLMTLDVSTRVSMTYKVYGQSQPFTYTSDPVYITAGNTEITFTLPILLGDNDEILSIVFVHNDTNPRDMSVVSLEVGGSAIFRVGGIQMPAPND